MSKKGRVMINTSDLVGKRVGSLQVVRYQTNWYDTTLGGERMRHSYLCRCDCGAEKVIRRGQLKNEIVHSCGCARKKRKDESV